MADEPLDLFAADEPTPTPLAGSAGLDLTCYRARVGELATRGAYLGTSSWKYPGWCGMVYDEQRYLTRGKFSEAKFNKTCLEEYAQTFSTVCVDAGYYQFPTAGYIAELCDQVPDGFKFAFKVTDEITQKRFPNIPRCGARAGLANANFLLIASAITLTGFLRKTCRSAPMNAEMFNRLFLGPIRQAQGLTAATPDQVSASKIGPLMFEFSTFHQADYGHGRDFMAELARFLGELPRGEGWEFGVEIRNKTWLVPELFVFRDAAEPRRAHVFNPFGKLRAGIWTKMPPVLEQLGIRVLHQQASLQVVLKNGQLRSLRLVILCLV